MFLQRNVAIQSLGISTFTFDLKILFKNFSQQHAGYHLVLTDFGLFLIALACHRRSSSVMQV
jgi:hypothetical protein